MNRNKTVSELLQMGRKQLVNAGKFAKDADLLLMHTTGLTKIQMLTECQQIVTAEAAQQYAAFLNERESGKPLQYILGEWEFMGLPFAVGEGVLIPRADTEVLVETILEKQKAENLQKGLDIGTGSGCIPICLDKLGGMDMTAVDISKKALCYANQNNQKNQTNVTFLESDLFSMLPASQKGTFDFIVSNPPYIPKKDITTLMTEVKDFEPINALDGGLDGLDFYRHIIAVGKCWIKEDGWLFFEIGYDQKQDLFALLEAAGFGCLTCKQDFAGLDRVICGKKKNEG